VLAQLQRLACTRRERITSDLDDIDGLGPRRRRQLLKHFGSVSAIREASLEDLARVPGLPQVVAEAVYRRYRG
jgi:excinuclease ABC subunit C